jgi:hypothetical protein
VNTKLIPDKIYFRPDEAVLEPAAALWVPKKMYALSAAGAKGVFDFWLRKE